MGMMPSREQNRATLSCMTRQMRDSRWKKIKSTLTQFP
jgi:hypothetical protein